MHFVKMDDLLQSQIKNSCQLALPNGLKELMWDISREVLRARPQNIYGFITKYLSALLVTRENLTVAAKVCDEICLAPCHEVLEEKLRNIGVTDEDIDTAKKVIMEHFGNKAKVNEASLLMKLMRKTSIDEDLFPAVQRAVRSVFVEQHVYRTNVYEPPPDIDDEVAQAASHTLKLYEDTSPTREEYQQMATKIQAAYRAYGVRREMCTKKIKEKEKKKEKSLKIKDDRVEGKASKRGNSQGSNNRASVTTESSTSLAGSYVKLPKYTPYSAHDVNFDDYEEVLEMFHSSPEAEDTAKSIKFKKDKLQKVDNKISFEVLPIDDDVLDADDESEGTIEESIHPESDDNLESNCKIHEIDEMVEYTVIAETADEINDEDEIDPILKDDEVYEVTELNKTYDVHQGNRVDNADKIDFSDEEIEDDVGDQMKGRNILHEIMEVGGTDDIYEEDMYEMEEINEMNEMPNYTMQISDAQAMGSNDDFNINT